MTPIRYNNVQGYLWLPLHPIAREVTYRYEGTPYHIRRAGDMYRLRIYLWRSLL
jgi:hypothetical protein